MTDSQSYTRDRKKGVPMAQDKKNQILTAAIDIFSEIGIEHAKVSDVVQRAGVAQGTFYLYYSSKHALIPAMAEQLLHEQLDSLKAYVQDEDPFDKNIRQMVDTIFSVTERYQHVLALCYSGLAMGGGLSEWEIIYEPYYQWMDRLLEDAQARGEVRKNINVRITSKLVTGMMEEAAEQLYLFDENAAQAEAYKKEAIQFIVRALM
ncbi:TetR/AcrR family transcriptional regulator [Salicibibacter halophilus]|uniref:TetR/AcrR family transcriptional regulator n=2 Tax=Salicibibacter halophilus TaxID=2502791 RepID=A0A514LG58_9BACI|nr:TetR/AcrR family transcriptional regulator [Salicibibacter halophilus]